MSATHIIRKHVLEVQLNGTEADGIALQARLSDLCKDGLLRTLQGVLDRYAPTEGHLAIEHLELDLGSVPLEHLETELAAALEKGLESGLREHMFTAIVEPGQTERTGASLPDFQSERSRLLYALRTFLGTGRLPWAVRLPSGTTLEQALLADWQLVPSIQENELTQVMLFVTEAHRARQRLILQFSEAFRMVVLRVVSPRLAATVSSIGAQLAQAGVPHAVAAALMEEVWNVALTYGYATYFVDSVMIVRQVLQAAIATGSAVAEAFVAAARGIWPEAVDATYAGAHATTVSLAAPAPQPPAHLRSADADIAEGIFITNAGAVLLHPFLPTLFRGVGIATDNTITDPDRAVALLHYLVTGERTVAEYDVTFMKVLCGIDTGDTLRAAAPLTSEQLHEAESMLDAVVRHWEALRGTSADGLRESFLKREGKLSCTEQGEWLVQVEWKTYDVLLDRLPWGIAHIQLPWMPAMCRVEWNP